MEIVMGRYWSEDTRYATLRDALAARNADELKQLAKLFVKGVPSRKDDCIGVIERALAQDGLRRMWENLDPLSRAAVAEVTYGKDEWFNVSRFIAKYGGVPRRYHEDYRDKTKNVSWTLLDVVFTRDTMPRDLKERFHAFVPPPARTEIATLDALPETVPSPLRSWEIRNGEQPEEQPMQMCQTERGALHDLVAVLRLVDAGKVSVSAATQRPTVAAAKAVLAVLRDGDFVAGEKIEKADDFIRPFAWPLIVQSAGLARLAGSKLELTKAGREALARPPHETLRHAWKRWIEKGVIDEFNRIDAIKGQKRKGRGGLTSVAERRVAVREVLATCPAEKWIKLDEFFRHFQATDIELNVAHDSWNLYLADAQYGSLGYDGYHNWSMVQGRYVMALLWEYAATLGLLDIAHVPAEGARDDYWQNWGADELASLSRYDGLMFFRITALGAYCLCMTEEYAPEPLESRPAFKILPNRDVVVQDASAFSSADALFLDRIAVKSGDHTWVLDKTRILEALESGIKAQDIHEFLTAMSQLPMPDNVRLFIDDTVRRAFLVSYEGAAEVFRVTDEATALLILNDSAGKSLCHAAGPTRLVVSGRNVAAFRRVLRQLGFIAPRDKAGS